MPTTVWIAIYLLIIMMFIIILPQNKRIILSQRLRKRKGLKKMSNELIKSYIGKVCNITTGSLGPSFVKVTIVEVVDNWIKVESKGKTDLINADFIQNIKIKS